MTTINLDRRYVEEVQAVKSMKERGVIQDYKSNEKSGIVWIKAEGEWIEVFSVDECLDSRIVYGSSRYA